MVGKTRKSLNNRNKNKVICQQCNTEILERDEALECDVCKKTLHALCSQVDKKQYDHLIKNPTIEYKCKFCAPIKNVSANDLIEIKTKLNQLDEIRETMHFMSSQYDLILKSVKKNENQIKVLNKRNDELKEEVKNLKSSVYLLNNIRVQKDCIINGIKVDDNKTAVDAVLDIATKTGVNISNNDLEDAYFLSRNKQSINQNNKKSIVVKFANKKSKEMFMREKSKLKEITDFKKVFVNDFLCKESLELLKYAKSLKEVGFKFLYTKHGNIYAKKNEKSRQICLKTMDDVDELLKKTVGCGSNRYILNTIEADLLDNDDANDDDDAQPELNN